MDLFAGAGGATVGLEAAGFQVALAVENHPDAAATYRKNHPQVVVLDTDIRELDPHATLERAGVDRRSIAALNSCPPCQGFSSLHRGVQDKQRNDLVLETLRWVEAIRPKIVILENVPRLRHDVRFEHLIDGLQCDGYRTRHWVVDASEIGAPQRRKRLILLACRDDSVSLPATLAETLPPEWSFERNASEVIKGLGRVGCVDDSLHVARRPTPIVKRRLAALPIGGNRFDLPDELQLECHKGLTARHATGSYGRIPTSGPCGTLTTRCTTPACGPFVHPRSARGISLREAALLQTFPRTYQFEGHYDSIERQIGNAVPPRLTQAVAHAALRFL